MGYYFKKQWNTDETLALAVEMIGMDRQFKLYAFIKEIIKDTFSLSWLLFKVMIPVLIIVKIMQELGFIEYFSMALEPLMGLIGLPSSMGLVWATTIVTNIYGGMVIFFSMQEPMTVAQVTVLSALMLLAHGLPIEVRITQLAGLRVIFVVLLRLISAFIFAYLLHLIYSSGNWLQDANVIIFEPQEIDHSWLGWAKNETLNLIKIVGVIFSLVTLLKILRLIGVERVLIFLLKPILKRIGIAEEATTITIVGVTLGLTFGGGLLIQEANKGHVSAKDIFLAMSLLSICHSLIEDTILTSLLGGHISGILFVRLIFSLLLIWGLAYVVAKCDSKTMERWFMRNKKEDTEKVSEQPLVENK